MIRRYSVYADEGGCEEFHNPEGEYVKHADIEPYERCREYLAVLLARFQWTDRGYGQLTCRSCGAAASENLDVEGSDRIKRLEECSRTCPWRLAGETLATIDHNEH
jgi:hypothetical protein